MYTVGKLHRWVNQQDDLAYLNGTECTVTGPAQFFTAINGRRFYAQPTDTPSPYAGHLLGAERGDLVPVDPPSGERSVLDLFKLPILETA